MLRAELIDADSGDVLATESLPEPVFLIHFKELSEGKAGKVIVKKNGTVLGQLSLSSQPTTPGSLLSCEVPLSVKT